MTSNTYFIPPHDTQSIINKFLDPNINLKDRLEDAILSAYNINCYVPKNREQYLEGYKKLFLQLNEQETKLLQNTIDNSPSLEERRQAEASDTEEDGEDEDEDEDAWNYAYAMHLVIQSMFPE